MAVATIACPVVIPFAVLTAYITVVAVVTNPTQVCNEKDFHLPYRVVGAILCVGNYISNAGRRIGSFTVYGLYAGRYRVDVTACQAKLFGIRISVRIRLLIVLYFRNFPFLGYPAVFDVFRLASACERVAGEI